MNAKERRRLARAQKQDTAAPTISDSVAAVAPTAVAVVPSPSVPSSADAPPPPASKISARSARRAAKKTESLAATTDESDEFTIVSKPRKPALRAPDTPLAAVPCRFPGADEREQVECQPSRALAIVRSRLRGVAFPCLVVRRCSPPLLRPSGLSLSLLLSCLPLSLSLDTLLLFSNSSSNPKSSIVVLVCAPPRVGT